MTGHFGECKMKTKCGGVVETWELHVSYSTRARKAQNDTYRTSLPSNGTLQRTMSQLPSLSPPALARAKETPDLPHFIGFLIYYIL